MFYVGVEVVNFNCYFCGAHLLLLKSLSLYAHLSVRRCNRHSIECFCDSVILSLVRHCK